MKGFIKPTALPRWRNNASGDARNPIFFNPPLSDFDILELQNLLMTPSIHYLKSQDVATGRFLINTVLGSLKHYHHVGCVTVVKCEGLSKEVLDLTNFNFSPQLLVESIESFFIENPYVDFAWIELTNELQKKISEKHMNRLLEILTSNDQTPVIIMKYVDNV